MNFGGRIKQNFAPALAVSGSLALALVMFLHVRGFNGQAPSLVYPWNRAPWMRFFSLVGLAGTPLAAAIYFQAPRMRWRLALLGLSIVLLRLLIPFARADSAGLHGYIRDVQSLAATSYHTDALRLVGERADVNSILANYPELLPHLIMHSREKPPGPVLFYFELLEIFGPNDAPAVSGLLLIAACEVLGVFGVYWLAMFWFCNRQIAFHAAALFCLLPGFLAHFPQFDTCYPAVVCAWAVLWGMYMRTGKVRYAIAFGVLFSVMTFWVYNLLASGILLLGISIIETRRGADHPWSRVKNGSAITLGALFCFYGLLYLGTQFDPFATLFTAMRLQADIDRDLLHRFWPATIPIDLLEFSVAVGWGVLVAAIATLAAAGGKAAGVKNAAEVSIVCGAQILIVAFSGLMKCETSRVWIFMMPLVVIPAAVQMSRWPRAWAIVFLAADWLATAAILQNI